MHTRLALTLIGLTVSTSACGLTSTAMDMKDTPMAGGDQNFASLAGAADKLGWKPIRGTSTWDWPLTVWVKDGEQIKFTENASTRTIAFSCDGDELDERKTCVAAVNQMWKIAFDAILIDD